MNARHFSFQGKLTDCRLTNTDLIVEVPAAILCKNVFTIPSFKLKKDSYKVYAFKIPWQLSQADRPSENDCNFCNGDKRDKQGLQVLTHWKLPTCQCPKNNAFQTNKKWTGILLCYHCHLMQADDCYKTTWVHKPRKYVRLGTICYQKRKLKLQ